MDDPCVLNRSLRSEASCTFLGFIIATGSRTMAD